MRVNYTDKILKDYINKGVEKRTMTTDVCGMVVDIRPTSQSVTIFFKIRYFKNGKRELFTLGTYPQITLLEARKRYLEVLSNIETGKGPEEQQDNIITFGSVYDDWWSVKKTQISANTIKKRESVYNCYIVQLNKKPLKEITPDFVLKFCGELYKADKGATGEYIANTISAVLEFAVFKELLEYNPLAKLSKYLPKVKTEHHASFNEDDLEKEMKKLFNTMSDCSPLIKCLLFMYFFTLLRSIELRAVKFENIADDNESMTVKTKTWESFKVTLSTQAKAVIKYLKANHKSMYNTYLFESVHGSTGYPSENILAQTLKRHGYKDKLTVHGIRTCGRQWLQTLPTAKESIIELCLSHVAGNSVQQAYNRGTYFDERKRIMQEWCNFVEKCIGINFKFVLQ